MPVLPKRASRMPSIGWQLQPDGFLPEPQEGKQKDLSEQEIEKWL